MGERPVAMQILMPRSCKRCRVSNIFGVDFLRLHIFDQRAVNIKENDFRLRRMGYLSFKRYTISILP